MTTEKIQSDLNVSAGAEMNVEAHEAEVSAAIDAAADEGAAGPGAQGGDLSGGVEIAAAVAGTQLGPVAAAAVVGASLFVSSAALRNNAPSAAHNPQSIDSRIAGHLQVVTKATAQPASIVPLGYRQKLERDKRTRGATASAARKGVPLGVGVELAGMSLTGGPVKTSPGMGIKSPGMTLSIAPEGLRAELEVTRQMKEKGPAAGSHRLEDDVRDGRLAGQQHKRHQSAQQMQPSSAA